MKLMKLRRWNQIFMSDQNLNVGSYLVCLMICAQGQVVNGRKNFLQLGLSCPYELVNVLIVFYKLFFYIKNLL